VVVRLRACLGWLALFAAFVPGAASAQHITTDGTLSRAQILPGPHYLIGAGLGRLEGDNLFQSFGIFGLTPGEIATFTGPGSVDNIIGRVTGGQLSSIDGTINSKIPGANIYLINPYGVVFGPQGTVNVSGGFYASTANYVKMANGARFQATHPRASTLTAAPPAAFGFLNAKPPAIVVDGSKLLARGTIGLVGGPVSIENAKIATPAGTIDVASVAGAGEVPVNPRNAEGLTVKRFGRVNIAGGSALEVGNPSGHGHAGSVFVRSGSLTIDASMIKAVDHGARTGGEIVLEASGRIALRDGADIDAVDFGGVFIRSGSLTIDASTIEADNHGALAGGGIVLEASGRIALSDGATVETVDFGRGPGGRLSVSTGRLVLTGGASLVTVAQGIGAAGPVDVAAGAILIDGRGDPSAPTGLGSYTQAKGQAGAVTVSAGSLAIFANGVVLSVTFGGGGGGNLALDVRGALTIDATGAEQPVTGVVADAEAGSTGSAGAVTILARSLKIVDGGEISSSATAGSSGNAGGVTVRVTGAVLIRGLFTGIFAQADQGSTGNAGGGMVMVRAGALLLDDGGQISVSSHSGGAAGAVSVEVASNLTINEGSGIFSNALAANSKAAGTITVAAGSLSIENGGQISAGTSGSGKGGDISVDVSGGLTITGAAGVFTGIAAQAVVGSTRSAGDIFVEAGNLSIGAGGEISTATFGPGAAGNVSVDVARRLTISGPGSDIDGNVFGTGHGGIVTVRAGALFLDDGAQISVSSASGGAAGAVSVEVTNNLTISGLGSGIDSNALAANSKAAGTITVAAGALSIENGGQISAGTWGSGKGGDISVDASGRLTITGAAGLFTGIAAQANSGSTGSGGAVGVTAGTLVVVDGGVISSATFGTKNAGTVTVSAGTLRVADAGEIYADSEAGSKGDAGKVIVKAGSLDIHDGLISSGLIAASMGKHAGTVIVEVSGRLTIDGAGSASLRGIAADANKGTTGTGGDVRVTAGTLSITDKGEIASSTFGAGRGGSVFVAVAGRLEIDGASSRARGLTGITSESNPGSSGSAGDVFVRAGSGLILDNGEISSGTFGSGKGGDVAVIVQGRLVIDAAHSNHKLVTGITTQANQGSTNNAGDVFVRAGSLSLLDGGGIESAAIGVRNGVPATTGSAGEIVVIVGQLLIEGALSDIATSTDPGTSGHAGLIEVTAGQILIAAGGEIISTTAGTGAGGSIVVTTPGALLLDGGGVPDTKIAASALGPLSGAAGSVTVTAGSLTIEGGAEIASTTAGPGAGGDVEVSVSGDIALTGPRPEITAQSTGGSTGSGNAGMIAISAAQLFMNNGARISTEAAAKTANGGNISLSLQDMLYLIDGEITTSVEGETGNGGNITIAAPFVILSGSDVIAQAVAGHGGNITIDAGQYLPSADSIVSASSAFGVSGNVIITQPRVDLNGTLVVLSSELQSAVAVTRASCAGPTPGRQSSLVEAGRGGLPEDPNASLPALYLAGRDLQLGPRVAPRRADAGEDLPSTPTSRLRCG
jgi:filamentous hemagglutinin family protein